MHLQIDADFFFDERVSLIAADVARSALHMRRGINSVRLPSSFFFLGSRCRGRGEVSQFRPNCPRCGNEITVLNLCDGAVRALIDEE
jgi:hypothetical protein